MASITSEIASSSSSLPKGEYDVFLSFRGEDTRNNFTDHLYAALDRKGIWTFKDDERLEKGTTISTELLNAIEKSKFAIIVLSRNYATSSWCLDELVKIVECKEKAGLTVLPVFYGVDPSDVRKQTGSFAEAFAKHELMKNEEKLQSWRAALTEVAKISGYDTRNANESTIIEEIAGKLIGGLHYSYFGVHEVLVGIQSRVEEMENLCLRMGFNEVHFIGIWGMGGIGKTTIAQVLYDRIRCHFAGSSFLANVRERSGNGGLVTLQKQLLSDVLFEKNIDIWDVQRGINLISNRLCHKKVLVILDDVDQPEQLKALAGKQSWFGEGSVIIIITRDQSLLIRHEDSVQNIYEAKKLDNDEALKLFSLKAFKQDNPLEGYEVLSENFVYYAQGLPLALKVLGSFMLHRDPIAWESELDRLKENPKWEILDVLRISFNGLRSTEQKIFLDIACFFKGMTIYRVANILQTSHYPYIDIDVLVEKSLITILGEEVLWMHDLIQELGKEIVRCESPDEPGGRSRLWLKKDILPVLKNNTGTEKVEGIFINTPSKAKDLNVEEKVEDLNAETFSKMRNLRLLKIGNVRLPQGLTFLSNDLRLMDWHGYPLKSMPRNFNPDKLVELIMPHSRIKQLWEGDWSLEWLRIIDLSDSRKLITVLDFARVPNLEVLILKGCTKLSKIHASHGDLKHLISLDLTDCKNLSNFPEVICSLTSLKILTLSGCSKLDNMPENLGNLESLEELDVSGTAIREPPSSIVRLKNLKVLSFQGCNGLPCKSWSWKKAFNFLSMTKTPKTPNLTGLPSKSWSWKKAFNFLSMTKTTNLTGLVLPSVSDWCSLISLNIRNCNLQAIPTDIGCLSSLEDLDLSGNNFVCLPESINQLSTLRRFWVENCKSLRLLPELQLSPDINIWANGCTSLESLQPVKVKDNSENYLYFLNCFQFVENQGRCDLFTTTLREYFQELCYRESTEKPRFGVVIPGNEVPNWFRHKSVRGYINLEVPSQFRGIAFCAVFGSHRHRPPNHHEYEFYLTCRCRANENDFTGFGGLEVVHVSQNFDMVESDHRWFLYLHPNDFKLFLGRTNKIVGSCQLEISFKSMDQIMKIKKCGAHVVYEEEMEDLKQSMGQSECSSSIIPYNEIKRSRDDENGASGEGSSTHIPDDENGASGEDYEHGVQLTIRSPTGRIYNVGW